MTNTASHLAAFLAAIVLTVATFQQTVTVPADLAVATTLQLA